MYGNQGVQCYRQTDISSMSSEKMIVLLYERVVTDLETARKALARDDRVEFSKQINHSQRIVSELRTALDHTVGGEIAQNLDSLYNFMFHEHLEILLDRKPEHIDNCLRVIEPLLDAWRQIPTGTGQKAAQDLARCPVGPNSATGQTDQRNPSGQTSDAGPGSDRVPSNLLSVSA